MNRNIMIGLILFLIFVFAIFFTYNNKGFTGLATISNPIESENLVLLNWENYLDPLIIEQFENATGINVEEVTFSTMNEEKALFKANPSAYDIIIVDDWNFRELSKLKEFQELDLSKIPNLKNIDDKYRHLAFDKENKYTIPFLIGTTGLMVNSRYINPLPDSWSILWDEKYAGKTALLDEDREVISAVLKKLGYQLNIEDSAQLFQVKDELFKQKAKLMDTVTIRSKLISEEILIGQIYSGDALYAAEINPNLVYITPKEGVSLWMDNMAISKQSKKKEQAYKFINFILEPEIGAMLANYAWYMTPNKASLPYVDEELSSDPSIFLAEEILEKSEYFNDISEDTARIHKEIFESYRAFALSSETGSGISHITGTI
jgi:spermidine/putrescine-binding protein